MHKYALLTGESVGVVFLAGNLMSKCVCGIICDYSYK